MNDSGVVNDILLEGLDDWVPLVTVVGIARRHTNEDSDAKPTALHAIAVLLEEKLTEAGNVIRDVGFVKWPEPPAATLERVRALLDHGEPERWWFGAWLALTDAGREAAQQLRNS